MDLKDLHSRMCAEAISLYSQKASCGNTWSKRLCETCAHIHVRVSRTWQVFIRIQNRMLIRCTCYILLCVAPCCKVWHSRSRSSHFSTTAIWRTRSRSWPAVWVEDGTMQHQCNIYSTHLGDNDGILECVCMLLCVVWASGWCCLIFTFNVLIHGSEAKKCLEV